MSYNGWTNYETWNVALWLGEGDDAYWNDRAEELYRENDRDERSAAADLANELRDYVTDESPLADGASMYHDLLSNALRQVNWHEIAEGYVAEVDIEDDEDED